MQSREYLPSDRRGGQTASRRTHTPNLEHPLLALQCTMGNRAVTRSLGVRGQSRGGTVQRDAKRGPIGQKRTVVDLKRALSYYRRKPLTKAVILQIQESVGTRADGIIGPKTVQAVADYQRSLFLVADGIAGPETLLVLGISAQSDTGESKEGPADPGLHKGPTVDETRARMGAALVRLGHLPGSAATPWFLSQIWAPDFEYLDKICPGTADKFFYRVKPSDDAFGFAKTHNLKINYFEHAVSRAMHHRQYYAPDELTALQYESDTAAEFAMTARAAWEFMMQGYARAHAALDAEGGGGARTLEVELFRLFLSKRIIGDPLCLLHWLRSTGRIHFVDPSDSDIRRADRPFWEG